MRRSAEGIWAFSVGAVLVLAYSGVVQGQNRNTVQEVLCQHLGQWVQSNYLEWEQDPQSPNDPAAGRWRLGPAARTEPTSREFCNLLGQLRDAVLNIDPTPRVDNTTALLFQLDCLDHPMSVVLGYGRNGPPGSSPPPGEKGNGAPGTPGDLVNIQTDVGGRVLLALPGRGGDGGLSGTSGKSGDGGNGGSGFGACAARGLAIVLAGSGANGAPDTASGTGTLGASGDQAVAVATADDADVFAGGVSAGNGGTGATGKTGLNGGAGGLGTVGIGGMLGKQQLQIPKGKDMPTVSTANVTAIGRGNSRSVAIGLSGGSGGGGGVGLEKFGGAGAAGGAPGGAKAVVLSAQPAAIAHARGGNGGSGGPGGAAGTEGGRGGDAWKGKKGEAKATGATEETVTGNDGTPGYQGFPQSDPPKNGSLLNSNK